MACHLGSSAGLRLIMIVVRQISRFTLFLYEPLSIRTGQCPLIKLLFFYYNCLQQETKLQLTCNRVLSV